MWLKFKLTYFKATIQHITRNLPPHGLPFSIWMYTSLCEGFKEEIGTENGVEKITNKLDSLFLKDKNTCVYLAIKDFYEYHQSVNGIITEFLVVWVS